MIVILELLKLVNKLTSTSARDFKKMIILRQNLQCNSNEIILKQKKLFQVIDILSSLESNSKINQEIAKNNKNYKKNEEITVFELEKVNYFSTVCQTHFQEKICHEHCGLAYQSKADTDHFMSCAAHGRGGNCRSCECSMKIHYHTYTIPREKKTTVEKIINEMKVVYDDATSKKQLIDKSLNDNETLKQVLINEVENLKKKLLQNCKDLKNICNNFNFHEELQAFIETLRKEASISRDFIKQKEFYKTAEAIEKILTSDEFKQNTSTFTNDSEEDSEDENNDEVESSSNTDSS